MAKDKKIDTDGKILVARDKGDKRKVNETGDHLGRKGISNGGGVVLLAGLVNPVLLNPVAMGAVASAVV